MILMKGFTFVTRVFTLKTPDCHLQARTDIIHRVQTFVISSENATISCGRRDRQFIPPEREKQKLTYDEDIKTFLQYFNKRREINLTEHAKRRYIHGTKNSSVYKRTWRHVLWQMIAKLSEECAPPQSGQRKMETSGFSEMFVTIYQSTQHDRLARLHIVTACSKH